jgi:hypothetical protein
LSTGGGGFRFSFFLRSGVRRFVRGELFFDWNGSEWHAPCGVPFRPLLTNVRIACFDLVAAPFQILGQPSKSLRKSFVHEVRDITLARTGQFGVPLRFFPIALHSLRCAFHFNTPLFSQLTFSSEMGRPDGGDGANARLN